MSDPEVKIEKGIPMPAGKSKKMVLSLVEKMAVGDSFILNDAPSYAHTQSRIQYARKKVGVKLIVRKVEGGFRIWRTE